MLFLFCALLILAPNFAQSEEPTKCAQNSIKYTITRFNKNFSTTAIKYERPQLTNDEKAYYITLDEDVPFFCRGILNITIETSHLWIDSKKIEAIESGAFANQNITGQLRVSNNLITIIKSGTFKNLAITDLDLSYNKIAIIESNAFENMPNIFSMQLSRNAITQIAPDSVVGTPKLIFFGLSMNKLSKIVEKQFDFMSKVTAVGIGVGVNELVEIHPNAFGTTKVWMLNLTHNHLTVLPKEILDFNVNKLQILDLEHNLIENLDDAIFKHPFSQLHLRGNKLNCGFIKKLLVFKEVQDNPRSQIWFDRNPEC